MNSYCVGELAKIAMLQKSTSLFSALDKLAMSSNGGRSAVGSAGMGHGSGLGGSTSMGGFSTHCDKCFAKVKEDTNVCPKCGGKLTKKRDMKAEEESLKDDSSTTGDNGDTGGEASELQEVNEDENSEFGKYGAKKKPWWKAKDVLDTPVGKAKAVGGLGLSSFGAIKIHQLTKDPPGEKRASTRIGPRGWNFKRKVSQKFVSSPALKMKSWKKKSRRSAKGLLP